LIINHQGKALAGFDIIDLRADSARGQRALTALDVPRCSFDASLLPNSDSALEFGKPFTDQCLERGEILESAPIVGARLVGLERSELACSLPRAYPV